MRLCWADKIPLTLLAILILILLWLGSGPTPEAYKDVTEAQHWAAGASILWLLSWKFVLPIWAGLRFCDLLGGGPAIRRNARQSRITPDRPPRDFDLGPGEWTRSGPDWSRPRR